MRAVYDVMGIASECGFPYSTLSHLQSLNTILGSKQSDYTKAKVSAKPKVRSRSKRHLGITASERPAMTFQQELSSWWAPKGQEVAQAPSIGDKAPTVEKLQVNSGTSTIILFLRHCGCPFAEKTFLNLRETAKAHKNLDFIAVSHSSEEATNSWLKSLPQAGSEPSNLRIVVDDKSEIYAAWGLGPSSYAHVLSPSSMYEAWRLGKEEGIWNRPTESGSRWQTSGYFAVDSKGVVRWGGAAKRADDMPDFEEAARAAEIGIKDEAKL